MSSSKDIDVTEKLSSDTLLKTPLIYIKRSISYIGRHCGIPVSIILSWLSYLSITNCILQFDKKDSVQVTRSSLFSSSIISFRSCLFETWSNAPFTSIKRRKVNFRSSHSFGTIWTSVTIASIADLFLQPPIGSECKLE